MVPVLYISIIIKISLLFFYYFRSYAPDKMCYRPKGRWADGHSNKMGLGAISFDIFFCLDKGL